MKWARKFARAIQNKPVAGIMVHGVFDLSLEAIDQWNPTGKHLHVSELKKALEEICRDFQPISLPDLLDLKNQNRWPEAPSFFLTFDDGYAGFEKLILPILETLNCPASFFPVTDFVDGKMLWMDQVEWKILSGNTFKDPSGSKLPNRQALTLWKSQLKSMKAIERQEVIEKEFSFPENKRPPQYEAVTWDELKRLNNHPLVTIGNHTVSHPLLAREDTETLEREIVEAANRLKIELGSCDLFCYPNGSGDDHDNRTRLRIEKSDHRCALLTHEALITKSTDPFLLPRFSLSHNTCGTDYFRNGIWGLRDLKTKFVGP